MLWIFNTFNNVFLKKIYFAIIIAMLLFFSEKEYALSIEKTNNIYVLVLEATSRQKI